MYFSMEEVQKIGPERDIVKFFLLVRNSPFVLYETFFEALCSLLFFLDDDEIIILPGEFYIPKYANFHDTTVDKGGN